MKIIALAGSPRKGGNTDLLTDALLESAAGAGASVEKVYLNDLDIRGCQACYVCRKKGKCKIDDDMPSLFEKLLEADAWVVATPVYWWGPSAQTKLVIDRLFPVEYAAHKERLKGKKGVLLTSFMDEPEAATPYLIGMIRSSFSYIGVEYVGEVLARAYKKGEVRDMPDIMEQARQMGKKLAGGS